VQDASGIVDYVRRGTLTVRAVEAERVSGEVQADLEGGTSIHYAFETRVEHLAENCG